MIGLTPLDVRKKPDDFDRALRGYEPEQVESFLELVAERLEELVVENRRLREEASNLEERLSGYQDRERALNEALLAAQELREDARAQADREAELKIREAMSRAEEIVDEARQRVRDADRELQELRARRHRFLRAFRSMLERFMEELETEEETLAADPGSSRPVAAAAGTKGSPPPGDSAGTEEAGEAAGSSDAGAAGEPETVDERESGSASGSPEKKPEPREAT